jgi:biopolymer transport protein ExbD
MKIRKSAVSTTKKVDIQMTPMIDCVFQLLAFFIMTFRIVSVEGDFNVTMPLSGPGASAQDETNLLPTYHVELEADSAGNLAGVVWENSRLAGLAALHQRALAAVQAAGINAETGSSDLEVELSFPDHLKYRHVVEAITAVSGDIDPVTGRQNKLIEKLKFAPR